MTTDDVSDDKSRLGMEIPWLTALRVLEKAHPHFHQKRGLGFGQLILKYQNGECKITRMETDDGNAPKYKIQIFGSTVIVVDKD